MSKPPSRGPYVVRTAEAARLNEALVQARAGTPSMVIISADAGVGKTRLLTEFANGCGARVLWGACLPLGDRGFPFAPLVEALRELQEDPELSGVIPGALLPLMTEQREGTDAQAASRSQLFQSVLGLLEELARQETTVLVLEDLHWADQSTRDLVTFLVSNLRFQSLLIIGSLRTDNLGRDHPLHQVLSEVARQAHTKWIELPPFTVVQVADQVQQLTGKAPTKETLASVVSRTQGNPYFVEELVAADGLDGRNLPASLRELLLVRANAVSPRARQLLGVASLAVTDIGDATLAEVAALPLEDVRNGLHEALDAHLLTTTPFGVRFRHALLQEALQQDLLAGERGQYHAAYARALESHVGSAREGKAAASAQLAFHLQEAGDVGKAMKAWIDAAAAAETVFAFADAHDSLSRALAAWNQVDDPEGLSGTTRVDILTRAAEDAFQGGDPVAATSWIREAIGMIDERLDPLRAGMLYERLSRYLRETTEYEKTSEMIERAVKLVPAEPWSEARARVLAGQAGRLSLLGRLNEARSVAEEALEIARAVGATGIEANVLNTLGVMTCFIEDYTKGLHQIEAALELARAGGDSYQQMRSYWNMSVAASEAGHWEEAIALGREAIEAMPRLGHGHQLPELYCYLQDDLMTLGRFFEARSAANEARSRFPALGDEAVAPELLIALGEFDPARQVISLSASRGIFQDEEARLDLANNVAELATWEGRVEEAREAINTALELSADSERPLARAHSLRIGMRCEADTAELARLEGRSDSVGQALERGTTLMRSIEDLAESPGPETGWKREIHTTLFICRAESTRLAGFPDPLAWREAVDATAAISMVYLETYAQARLAEAMLSAGDDRDGAVVLLRGAHERTLQWETRPLKELIEGLGRRAGIELGLGSPKGGAHGLTTRESQVLVMVSRGASNRQIAEELFISEKTASVHVSNIIRKLGVTNRNEAAAIAHREGLVGI
ncbi:MAG: AAA family ATPase [Acidimicrobiia bacterium]